MMDFWFANSPKNYKKEETTVLLFKFYYNLFNHIVLYYCIVHSYFKSKVDSIRLMFIRCIKIVLGYKDCKN